MISHLKTDSVSKRARVASWSNLLQVIEENCDLVRSTIVALTASFPKLKKHEVSYRKFVLNLYHAYLLRPTSTILSFKRNLTIVKLSILEGRSVSREVLGRILPRQISKTNAFLPLLQYCKLSRALTPIEVEARHLEEQYYRMALPCDRSVDPAVAAKIDQFKFSKIGDIQFIDYVSSSSCLSKTVKQGGRNADLSERVVQSKSPWGRASIPRDTTSGLSRVNRVTRFIDKRVPSYDAKPIAIAERGGKVRIVTKHDSELVALSATARRALWPFLNSESNRPLSVPLKDSTMVEVTFPKGRGHPSYKVFSADLSAATDYLSHEAISLVANKVGCPLSWISPLTLDNKPVFRGTAMGLPASWPVLSIIHYAICSVVDPNKGFYLKGDDLIALWNESQIESYYDLCDSVGFVVNKSKSVLSDRYGTFCEFYYQREGSLLRKLPIFSIKSWCESVPVKYDSALQLIDLGVRRSLIHRLNVLFCQRYLRVLRKVSIDPYLPEVIGGFGLLPKQPNRKVSKSYQIAISRVHNGLTNVNRLLFKGVCTDMYNNAFLQIKRSIHGSPDLDKVAEEKYLSILPRTIFVDITNKKYLQSIDSFRVCVDRLQDQKKKLLAQGGIPKPITYGRCWEISRNIYPNQDQAEKISAIARKLPIDTVKEDTKYSRLFSNFLS
ncbi:RNA-dependent RNA polymerase [Erysiphe necator associated narnavirus 10]|nr:RNA-dependent RNA polymerase [Erysiphe necator associated narnavirus 10]